MVRGGDHVGKDPAVPLRSLIFFFFFVVDDFCFHHRSRARRAELRHLPGRVREWGGAVDAAPVQAFVPWGVHQTMAARTISDLPRL